MKSTTLYRVAHLLWQMLVVLLVLCVLLPPVNAGESIIVAFGASNTYGKGVSRSDAYPAQLQVLLRAKGYNVQVKNAGVNAQTTGAMLRRLDSAIPAGTKLVIFQPGTNDRRKGVAANRKGNISEIMRRLSERGIAVIRLTKSDFAGRPTQADGQHLTPQGYKSLAQSLVPRVVGVISH